MNKSSQGIERRTGGRGISVYAKQQAQIAKLAKKVEELEKANSK